MRTILLAGLLALCGTVATARADDWKDESGTGRGFFPGGPPPWAGHGEPPDWARGRGVWDGHFKHHGGIPPGQAKKLFRPGHGYGGYPPYPPTYHGHQGWIGVPGLDAGYDQWRRDAERSYRRGDIHIQGWQQRPYPYPYVQPGHGDYPPIPSPYGWPR
ncbi:hypothetical protein [Tautonia plasticadhaerens]|uniref:Uncharacterized protein n=1 Tax=Tautonia plasticadhaerens TaxID=2527974 RepID=A0A518HEL4_9BACT|nr:hypothetical protein [Tautonia plasticadhaerens]QDV39287.1 hypothetical protein ElP_72510 [Tautonia plasticadhaerens]